MTRWGRRLVVVGDALLDLDVEGSVSRLCPDAPAPVLDERRTVARPGGAALAATVAARGGAGVTLVTALADDAPGEALRALLVAEGIEVVDLHLRGATPEKVRLRVGGHSMLRLDRGGPEGVRGDGIGAALAALGTAAAVLVADYGRGVAGLGPLRDGLRRSPAPLVWDPHPRGGPPVAGATIVTPSQAELFAAVPEGPPLAAGLPAIARRGRTLVRRWQVGAAAVTMGAGGALLARATGAPLVVPAQPIAVGDTCGAGDAFAATLATVLGSGGLVPQAVEDATAAATAFVEAGAAAGLAVDVQEEPGFGPTW
ncbi:MAG: D-beta-D-heptose 1-phosphate adenosyltransferase, partial [Acidimicrobiales bacterium]|nr:D-beta-D-heptose 1-phosphate adenosyltransferase [Acidimicrobiales bacterium]